MEFVRLAPLDTVTSRGGGDRGAEICEPGLRSEQIRRPSGFGVGDGRGDGLGDGDGPRAMGSRRSHGGGWRSACSAAAAEARECDEPGECDDEGADDYGKPDQARDRKPAYSNQVVLALARLAVLDRATGMASDVVIAES